MIDEHLRELASLYALGALPHAEAAAFESELRGNAELAALVQDYQASADVLVEDLPAASLPPALRRNILSAIRTEAAPKPAAGTSTGWLPWAVAAGLALTAFVIGIQTGQRNVETRQLTAANQRIEKLRAELETRAASLDRTSADLHAAQVAIAELKKKNAFAEMQVATLTSKLDASYLASIAWDENAQEGILHVRRLPAPDADKAYQLWVVDPNHAAPVSGGVFTVESDGSAIVHFAPTDRVSDVTAFAVTMEKEGGVPKAEGPLMLSN